MINFTKEELLNLSAMEALKILKSGITTDINSLVSLLKCGNQFEDSLLDEIVHFHQQRLYHEETVAFTKLAVSNRFSGVSKILILAASLDTIRYKLNPLEYCQIIHHIAASIDPETAIALHSHHDEFFQGHSQTKILNSAAKIRYLIILGRILDSSNILEELHTETAGIRGHESSVLAVYHKAAALVSKAKKDHAAFHKHGTLFLSYVKLDEISPAEIAEWAYELPLNSLMADTIFCFGELVQHPILNRHRLLELHKWVIDFVQALHEADWEQFETLWNTTDHNLHAYESILRHKMTLLAFVDLAFKKPRDKEFLTFSQIAERSRLPIDKVERMVMHATRIGLVKASIDQVDETVKIDWIKPKVLDFERLQVIQQYLENWTNEASKLIESISKKYQPELIV